MTDTTSSESVSSNNIAPNSSVSHSKPKSLTSNAAWSVFLTIWTTVVSFFLVPFLIGRIGTDYYGLYVLLMSVSGFLGIMSLGLGEATLRYVAFYFGRDDLVGINRVVSATLFVYIIVAALVTGLMCLGSSMLVKLLAIPTSEYDLGTRLLQLTAINFSLVLISNAIGGIPKALQRYDISTKIMIAQNIVHFIGTVTLVLKGFGIYGIVFWSIVTSLFTLLVNIIVSKRLIPELRLRPSFSKDGLKEVFSYGIFSMITQILGIVWGQADRLLLGILVNSASVAYLTVPQNLAFRASFGVNSAGSVLFPKFSGIKDDQEIKRLFLDSTWVLLCATIIIFVPLTVLIPDFLRLWISPEFSIKSAWIGQIIAFSCLVRGAFMPYDSLFRGIGKPQYLTILFTITGSTSFILNLILIPRFGLAGAGYCYLATLIWGFVTIIFTCKKILKMTSLQPLIRAVILPIIVGFIALIIVMVLKTQCDELGWIGFFAMGAAFVIITSFMLLGIEMLFGGRNSRAELMYRIVIRHLSFQKRMSSFLKKFTVSTKYNIKKNVD